MIKYMKKHEEFITDALELNIGEELERLKKYHKIQIEIIQHERLAHLLVTLSFGLFFLIAVLFAAAFNKLEILLLGLLFLVLLIPYIIHYYKLENGVQKWYGLYNEIDKQLHKNPKKQI